MGDLFDRHDNPQAYSPQLRTSPIRTSFDERTNSLIVVGAPDDLAVIESLMERLDTPASQSQETVREKTTDLQLSRRVEALEMEIKQLRSGADRASRGGRDPFSRVSRALPQDEGDRRLTDTRIKVEVQSPKGTPLKVVSVVPIGKRVKKGDLLFALDTTSLEAAVDVQQMDVERGNAANAQGETTLKNTLLQQESTLAGAKVEVELAKLDLIKFSEATRPLQQLALGRDLQQAKQKLTQQERTVEAGRGDANSLEKLKIDLRIAEAELEIFEKYTTIKTIKELEYAVAAAERGSQRSRSLGLADVAQAEANRSVHRNQVEQSVKQLKRLQDNLKSCMIVAPHDGVVAAAGSIPVLVGSEVRNGQVVLFLIPDRNEGDVKK
ncbi:MAG: secretin N-terminal domain-containing protein [Fuerstiella sp.]